ncbi:sensor histidine kinase [Haloactinomyces albus]|uniref:histidine kinase n=1 Tax=Haloactinomyces albus TaxID=1352928 RepID=A0AAE4CNU6_9ACTN|nr:histidine kinase dimerization/phosphoacceptor domain-containing protein [Haloactinomyces albus]MDR7303806.1 hypothetical protein [Haloactinomyces albus]
MIAPYLLAGYPYGPIQLCMVVAMFEVARLHTLARSLMACDVATAVISAAVISRLLNQVGMAGLMLVLWASWLIIPWSLGALAHVRAAAMQRMHRDLAARAALEERMRIAKEVHDIAGHGFSAVAMQAGVALLVFDEQPDQARKSLDAIQTTSTKCRLIREARSGSTFRYNVPSRTVTLSAPSSSSTCTRARSNGSAATRRTPRPRSSLTVPWRNNVPSEITPRRSQTCWTSPSK